MKYNMTVEHLGFCATEQQQQIVRLRLEGLSHRDIANELGIDSGNVGRTLKVVYTRAMNGGIASGPEAGLPEDLNLTGVTNLYSFDNGERTLTQQYVMGRKKKTEDTEKHLTAFAEGLCADIKPVKPRKAERKTKYRKDLLPGIFIGDAHIGMRAFGVETKHHDFDTKIATDQLKEAFHYLTERAEPSENCLFVDVGDAIHANTQHGTTVSGTPLDVDTRHYSVMKACAECMAYGINLQLERHKNVTVVIARGNHNSDAAGAIQLMLEFCYKDEPRVNVLPTHGFFHYIEWGNWLLGVHHGDKQKPEKLATSMARDMPEAWGRTTHRMWCTGHFHKEQVKTLDGVKHKVFAALPPPDSWHASHGFSGDGEMEMLTFKRSGGVHSSFVFNVPQPRVEPDVKL